VFTRLPAAIRTRSFGEVVRQLKEEAIPIVETPLIEKEAFRSVFAGGGGLDSLDAARVSGLDAARFNAELYTASVFGMFRRANVESEVPPEVAVAA
jgi:chromosome partitioning protein